MPELPEVETIAHTLREGARDTPGIVGRIVEKAVVNWAGIVEKPSSRSFKKRIIGQKIVGISRRGKFIRFDLSKDTMLVHLRMSGDLRVGDIEEKLGNHVRLALHLDKGLQLAFNNPRKFGRIWLLADPENALRKLGPEPFDPELTPDLFYQMLNLRKRLLKPLLLDQAFLAGMGNIYTDEALNLAKIHPLTRSDQLSKKIAAKLLKYIREVLAEGIKRNGASIDWVYQGGDFQNYFRVYQRTGEPCLACGTLIERVVVGQRSTHYCPTCQVLSE